jgi:hypothetical protein
VSYCIHVPLLTFVNIPSGSTILCTNSGNRGDGCCSCIVLLSDGSPSMFGHHSPGFVLPVKKLNEQFRQFCCDFINNFINENVRLIFMHE